MRMARSNKQKMWYALYGASVPIYDYYTDEEGNKIPIDTGETKTTYEAPVEFYGNIALSGSGEARTVEYGVDTSGYEAVLITEKDLIPITETSIIWFGEEPKYLDDGTVDEHSATHRVIAVKPSINVSKYILSKTVK